MMRLVIDEQEAPLDNVGVPAMNFGQPVLTLTPRNYALSVDITSALEILEPLYTKFGVEDLADEQHERGEFLDLDELQSLKYPPVVVLSMENPDLLCSFIRVLTTTPATEEMRRIIEVGPKNCDWRIPVQFGDYQSFLKKL